ncbi:nectin-2-like isoform X4 [Betta splendens]|uniref:Nectin-2-like isoform X4 n=1 Tax=Betta splendens TaxID=158456 RepID=A0A9W2XHB9_BETSP|nr:nectin-2-like isoform X4 [Betta splendens]
MSGFSPGRLFLLLLLLLLLNLIWTVEAVRVVGGNVSVVLGESATLPCNLLDTTETLTQISWQRMTKGKPENVNFITILADKTHIFSAADYRFKNIGNFTKYDGTLQLSDATLLDEGSYSCIFTLFPSGNFRTDVTLNLLVPPVVTVKDDAPLLGGEEASLATCTAAGSRPPAEVKWIMGSLEGSVRSTTTSTLHDNGTTTTVSSLLGVPTRDVNQRLVRCVVTSAALTQAKSLPFTLQVFFSPTTVNVTKRSDNSLECMTEANPAASFTWSRADKSWPQSGVTVVGPTLQLVRNTDGVDGLYQCEASNQYGRSHGYLYVHVTSGSRTICWVIFSLLLVLSAIGHAAWYYLFIFRPKQSREDSTHAGRQPVPTEDEEAETPVRVVGGNVSVVLGESATLPCNLLDTTDTLTQISWQKKTKGKPVDGNFVTILADKTHIFNDADYRFKNIGNFTKYDGTLQLSDATLLDEGSYLCIFTLFPSGNFRTDVTLNLLVPPVVTVKDDAPLLGGEEASLATCTAAGSRPPAEVKWIMGSLEGSVRSTTTSTLHDNGTTTTVSSLLGVPTRDVNQRLVRCVVTSAALTQAKSLPFTLQVFFSPTTVNITKRSDNSFECMTEANPAASFTWSRADKSWPQSGVTVVGPTLQFVRNTAGVDGLYQCEASNLYGRRHGYLYVHVTSEKRAHLQGCSLSTLQKINLKHLYEAHVKCERMYSSIVVESSS